MNRQERDELLQFLQPLLRTRVSDKDPVAESLILAQCAGQPDALYLLVQRAMALTSALQTAQTRLAELQAPQEDPAAALDAASTARAQAQAIRHDNGAWGRGLLTQVSATGAAVGLGVAAGIVAGGLLLDAVEDGWGDDL